MTDTVVEIEAVTKRYDDLIAVDGVTLKLERGKTLGLIGPNGAGKTTLLRMISSLAKPDMGDIRVGGQSVRASPRSVREILGFMPAEFGSPRNQTIGEYLEYFACMYGLPRKERGDRVRDVCELTDLIGREEVMVKGLSTGNKQRLLLAKTLLHDPELLVLDEPASGLDPRARTELRLIIRELASMGKTIIVSSHILPDLEEISDRIGIMEAGKLVLDSDISSLHQHHSEAKKVIKVRVQPEQTNAALEILSNLEGVNACHVRDQFLVIDTLEPDGNFILKALIENDLRITQFAEDAPNLEEIFMRSTAGKVT
ncbi:MAG: ABC transporter ATP-binding protein [Planctomycetaceae bacterium]